MEAESQVLTAEKNLLYQKEHLGFTEMRSPYDGLVTRRDRDPGGVVVPGASVLQLVATNEIWVSAWVDETAMAGLRAGQPARVVFRSEPGKRYAGEVARLGREADRETREFVVDVRVKELPENWTIGQRAEVFIETGRKIGRLVMPAPFVRWRENKARRVRQRPRSGSLARCDTGVARDAGGGGHARAFRWRANRAGRVEGQKRRR